MNFLKVNLWGRELGRLVWDERRRTTYFMFNPNLDQRDDVSSLLLPLTTHNPNLPVYGDDRRIYQGLPPFLADSLPDSWGHTLFDHWVKVNKIPRSRVTPLYKLMFIGRRGMGALEFEPSASELEHTHGIDMAALYQLSLKVVEDRENVTIASGEELTMQALLAVGTSAGGRQMKAILAINPDTGEIRSGQTDGLNGFEYCLVKFGDAKMPTAEIEMAYHKMAMEAGIVMEDCQLMPVEGVNHFLTKRFDRKDGKKIHMQTLAAINPEASSYEDLVATAREIGCTETEIAQIYRRMVFNVLANNTDDHNKNFSFLLEEGGRWRLAPAYDLTFIFNERASGPQIERCLSIMGKIHDITPGDLIEFGRGNDIPQPSVHIEACAQALHKFQEHAATYNIGAPWSQIVSATISDNLVKCCQERPQRGSIPFTDSYGRTVSDFRISLNTKGHYVINAKIDGQPRRRFVRPNMDLYASMATIDLANPSESEVKKLMERLFP